MSDSSSHHLFLSVLLERTRNSAIRDITACDMGCGTSAPAASETGVVASAPPLVASAHPTSAQRGKLSPVPSIKDGMYHVFLTHGAFQGLFVRVAFAFYGQTCVQYDFVTPRVIQ